MIMIREDDSGTEVHEPRLHTINGGDLAMSVSNYVNGSWTDTYDYPVPGWPALRRSFLDDGFRESTEKVELHAGIDPAYGTLAVTSLFHAQLDEPGTGDPDDPAESYVDQADTVLHRAGFTRLNNWWRSDRGLTTTVVKQVSTLIPADAPFGMSVALRAAAGAIRNEIGIDNPDASPTVAADHLRLLEDPTWRGFGAGLVEIARHDYPNPIKRAVDALMVAVERAVAGDEATVTKYAGWAVKAAAQGE